MGAECTAIIVHTMYIYLAVVLHGILDSARVALYMVVIATLQR